MNAAVGVALRRVGQASMSPSPLRTPRFLRPWLGQRDGARRWWSWRRSAGPARRRDRGRRS